jgi:thiosulfate/3-mercaptopyruvate sulfurtransferase
LASGAQVLDARSAGRFAGTAPEPRPGLPSGHMPGATSVPFTELVEAGRLKQPTDLAAIFKGKGVDLSRPITTTCGSGITAAVVSLALELAGAPEVTLYDGSWAEYAAHPQTMIEHSDVP